MSHQPWDAEVQVTEAIARAALRRGAAPYLASAPLRIVGERWDNVVFRVGEGYALRLPRRARLRTLHYAISLRRYARSTGDAVVMSGETVLPG